MQRISWLIVSSVLVGSLGACRSPRPTATPASAPAAAAPTSAAPTNPAGLVERYLNDFFEESPHTARNLGLHEYDGKVAPISPQAVAHRVERAKQTIAAIDHLDLSAIADPTKLDLELVRLHASQTLFELEVMKEAGWLMRYQPLFDVSSYLTRDYAPLNKRVSMLLDHVEAATKAVPALLSILDQSQPRTYVETAKKIFAGLREYFEGDVKAQSAPALAADPALKARYEQVIPAGLHAVDQILEWIAKVGVPNQNENFALGEQKFLQMLEVNEGLKTSLPELEKISNQDFEKNAKAMVEVTHKLDPKHSTREVYDKVAGETLHADQVIPRAQAQLDTLLAFIEKKQIITIGSPDRATVAVAPPFMRWNSAFLEMAGPFEKAKGSFYYISPPDPSWSKAEQDAYLSYEGDLLATSIHEVYPGHFVQGLHQRTAQSKAQKIFESYAFTEGWAHYTEQMMFDEGYGAGDPKLMIGFLSNALLRNCRFIAAIGLHTKGMTVAEADRLFRDKCFIDPGNASQQAYRGTFDPGYLSYTLGKLEIMQLREKFFEKRKTHNLKEFHDWLLSFGSSPIPLIASRL